TLTVTAKCQVTLRKEVLRHLGVVPGQKVEVDMLPNGRLELRAAKSARSIEDFFGCLHQPGTKPLSIEEIGDVTAQGWAGIRSGSLPIPTFSSGPRRGRSEPGKAGPGAAAGCRNRR